MRQTDAKGAIAQSDSRGAGQAVVIGGGFGGMAAALRLRARGHGVTLVERGERLGGRAQVYRAGDFTFDAGPTVITAPYLFDELFGLFGKRRSDYVRFLDVAPWYRIRFYDGSHLDYGPNAEATEAEIRRLAPDDLEGYRRFAAHTKKLFEIGFEKLGPQPFHDPRTLLATAPDLVRLEGYRSVYGLTAKHMRDERLRQAFSLQPLLVGGSPRGTTCIYALIHELERRWGVVFAEGGTGALVDAMWRLLIEEGVDIRTGTTVRRIDTDGTRATGVTLDDGTSLPATCVVANSDPAFTYRTMLPDVARRKRWSHKKLGRMRYAMGLFVMYFGTDVRYTDLAHHTILMGPDYVGELKNIFKTGRITQTPSLYLHRPTATDPRMAPQGKDAFYVLAAVPNLQAGTDWATAGPALRETILQRLESTVMPNLRQHLEVDFHITPETFQDAYLAEHGSAFTIQPTFTQSAWFRFHNRSEELAGLYFVGAGTHPGAGVPGVLTSAKVLENVLDAEPDPAVA
jgi:phytoene desaturase